MSRIHDADFLRASLTQLTSQLEADRRICHLCALCLEFLLGHLCFFLGNRALCHSDNAERVAVTAALLQLIDNRIQIIRDFRNQNNICAARNACAQGQPAGTMTHDFYQKYTAVRGRRRMHLIQHIGRNVHRGLIAKRNLGAPQVVVDGLWQRNDVQTFLAQQVRGLCRAVTAENNQTVQLHVVVGLNHLCDLINAVFVLVAHIFKRLARSAENGAANRQNAGKVARRHEAVFSLNESLVSILKAVDFYFLAVFLIQRFCNAAQGRVQSLTIAAACQHTNSFHAGSSFYKSHSFDSACRFALSLGC